MTGRIHVRGRGVALVWVLGLVACGSGNPPATQETGDAILAQPAVKVTFQSSGGGFHGVPPQGAACDPARWTYVIAMATHDVRWTGCTMNGPYDDPASFVPSTVDHPLDAAAWPAVESALANLHVSDETRCGADKDSWTLTVERSDGTVTYGDDFYACEKQYQNYVAEAGLDALYAVLSKLP
jgi:hypothetical protein